MSRPDSSNSAETSIGGRAQSGRPFNDGRSAPLDQRGPSCFCPAPKVGIHNMDRWADLDNSWGTVRSIPVVRACLPHNNSHMPHNFRAEDSSYKPIHCLSIEALHTDKESTLAVADCDLFSCTSCSFQLSI